MDEDGAERLARMSTAIRIVQGRFGRVALLDMNQSLVTHAHRECHVLLKAGGADAAFEVHDTLNPLTDSSVVLVNTWEPHAYVHPAGSPATLILALYIKPEWLAEIDRDFRCSEHPQFFASPCVGVSPLVRLFVERLAQSMAHDEAMEQDALYRLMCEIVSRFSRWKMLRVGLHPSARIGDFRVRRSCAYLEQHAGEPLDSGKLAALAGLSRGHFYSRFRETTGLTPSLYRNVVRMEQALRMLSTECQPISDVSMELGFTAQSHFTRFFRQHLGITPTEYRRKVDLVA